jgi:ornithine cyclodeaminase/alanine dehydrogenase-like protein (mu-crystallin family)
MSSTGHPIGFLNAEEITAFRTALASSILLVRRHNVKTLTVFGSGKQAFWHIRLALLLRGHTIKTVNIVSRTFTDRVRDMVKGFYSVESERKSSEGWTNTKFSILTPAYGEYSRLIKEQLRAADVIICTVPSTAPVFDHTILSSTEGRRKGRLTIAIGSYQPHMIEIPPELLHQAVKDRSETRHFHKHALEGGVVVVDTLTGCLAEAGEIIQSQLSPQQLVEVGELVMLETPPEPPAAPEFDSNIEADLLKLRLEARSGSGSGSLASIMREDSHSTNSSGSQTVSRKSSFGRLSRRSSRSSQKRSESVDSVRKAAGKKDDHMSRWLSEGNVIYKSVGLGLMDLVVGGDLVKLAREKGVGITIQDF